MSLKSNIISAISGALAIAAVGSVFNYFEKSSLEIVAAAAGRNQKFAAELNNMFRENGNGIVGVTVNGQKCFIAPVGKFDRSGAAFYACAPR